MMLTIRKILWIGFFGLWVSSVAAQSDCPTIVQNALNATDIACAGTNRNQACYGNISLLAEPQEGVADFNFQQPGDMVDVARVRTLTLEPLDAASDIWGVALMRLQANLPETLPGQNVTFLLFGDVEIRNVVETNVEPITFDVAATGNINVRSGPSTNDERISQLVDGETVVADGRNPDSTWLRIQLPDGNSGWVSAELVTFTDDLSLLNVVDPLALPPPSLTPMQAFYFQSGIGDAPCDQAPDSGILIQTPEGVGQISFTVNEVDIQLGSTAYLQAQASGDMTVNVVENQATVSAEGTTRFVPAGSRVRVPLDANLAAAGPPSEPEPYDNADLAALPVGHMPRTVEVATALTQAELDALSVSTLPVSGDWEVTFGTVTLEGAACEPNNVTVEDTPSSQVITLNGAFVASDIAELALGEDLENAEFTNPEPGLFVAEWDLEFAQVRLEVGVLSPTQVEGATLIILRFSDDDEDICTGTLPFTMVALSE